LLLSRWELQLEGNGFTGNNNYSRMKGNEAAKEEKV
jgi:hypothetical protein